MGFSEIIGHERPLATLRQALGKGRLHHAYLFVGPEGVGKRTVASALAKAAHCDDRAADFCDRCANCARIQHGNHPDVGFIEILQGKKEISIQQVRDMERDLNFRSFSGKQKIAIIDPATSMNLSAQNALLKTLEEPPQGSLLILIAPNAGSLLPTLRSRCLRLAFAPLSREAIAGYLTIHKGILKDKAEVLSAMSMGSLGAALKLEQGEWSAERQGWVDMVSSLIAGDFRGASAMAEAVATNKEESLRFLAWAETWYRDLLVYAATQNPEELVNLDMLAPIQTQAARGDVRRMLAMFAQTARAASRIQRNLNRRMVLESLLFNVAGGR